MQEGEEERRGTNSASATSCSMPDTWKSKGGTSGEPSQPKPPPVGDTSSALAGRDPPLQARACFGSGWVGVEPEGRSRLEVEA